MLETAMMNLLKNTNSSLNDEQLYNVAIYAQKYKLHPNILYKALCLGMHSEKLTEFISKEKAWKSNKLLRQLENIRIIKKILNGTDYIWIKGAPLSIYLYGDPIFRKLGDMDILVKQDKLEYLVNSLVKVGFQYIGAEQNYKRRYSHTYHEIQLLSPNDCLVEIKCISGEMDVFEHDGIQSLFFQNSVCINIMDEDIITSDLYYTYLHLFMTAISNSTTWFFMDDTGLREFYEIFLFSTKYHIDYSKFRNITKDHGMIWIVNKCMQIVNSLFGEVFDNSVLTLFDENNYIEVNQMESIYKAFYHYYDANDSRTLFDKIYKREKYYSAIHDIYYLERVSYEPTLKVYNNFQPLKYQACIDRNSLNFEIRLKEKQFYSKKGYQIIMTILNDVDNSKGNMLTKLVIEVMDDGQISHSIDNHMWSYSIEFNRICDDERIIRVIISDNKHDRVEIFPFNIQLCIENTNDTEPFRVFEICPVKNTLCLFKTIEACNESNS